MKTKFTKGEWRACCLDLIPHFIFAEEKCVCSMRYNTSEEKDYEPNEEIVTIEECVANARLIQAAPRMFKFIVMAAWEDGLQEAYDIIGEALGKKVTYAQIQKMGREYEKLTK